MYLCINRPWPTDAAACCRAKSFGRVGNLSGASPVAIAPDETTKTSAPDFRNVATASTNKSTNLVCRDAPSGPVKEDEPILRITRPALLISVLEFIK